MTMKDYQEFRPGVLNQGQIISLKENVIDHLNEEDVDPSAFDLHLSQQGWEMQGSIKGSNDTTIDKITGDYNEALLPTEKGPWILKKGETYIFRLQEYLKLPENSMIFGKATGRSSIGRLDVLTRLMVNNCSSFDTIENDGYKGSLYLEVSPITFPIKLQKGFALCQLRLFRGKPELSEIKEEVLQLFGPMILKEDGKPKTKDLTKLTVNLTPDKEGISAFKTIEKKKIEENNLVVDLTQGKESHDPKDFWEPEFRSEKGTLEIEPERFYILRSKERFKLPKDVAVYCQAISETLGELRIHYAGFVHPGFGLDQENGTPIIFEVRGHNVKVILRDEETLAQIHFYRMSQPCSSKCLKTKKTVYGNQELKLSKYFRDWVK